MNRTHALRRCTDTARRWGWLGLWLWVMALGAHAHATVPAPNTPSLQPITLDGLLRSVPLAQHSVFWIDPGGTMTVQDIEDRQASLPLAVRHAGHRVRLGERAALWVRFDAWVRDNRSHWELELTRSGTDRISLYHRLADGHWHEQHAGDHLPVSEWANADRYPVFGLDMRSDAPVTYWVRIEHARVPFSGELVIHSHDHLRELRMQQQFLLGAYFGMTLLLTMVALANALVFRDSSFGAYAIYISLLGLSLAASLGVGGQFVWPHSASWNSVAEFILLPLAAVAALLFVRHVVQPRRIGRSLDRLSLTLAGVFLLVTAWDVIAPSPHSFNALTVTGSLTLVVVYAMLWAAWRTGDRWVRWIALGILPVLLAGSLPVLRNFGLISSGFLTQYATVIAAAIEAPLLIYGLLQRSSLQHEAQARARALVITEPLTGLTNRHNFMLRLHDSLVRAQRYQHKNALLLIALDNHDGFNAEHGREVADRALVLTGSLLRSVARDIDTAARVDDNLFALLMEGPVRAAQAVAAATAIVAGGLRPSDQLPVGSSMRFKVVIALLPDEGHELQLDTQTHMGWLRDALDDLRRDKRKGIATLNF